MTLEPLWLLGFMALGALLVALGGLAAAALIWRFQGREGALLKSEPKSLPLDEMPTETS